MRKYKTIYSDKYGTEKAEIQSDGSEMKITLRGIDFEGTCFEILEGEIDKEKFDYQEYEGNGNLGDLINCKFQVEIPIKLIDNKHEFTETVHAEVQTEENDDHGVFLRLSINKTTISNTKKFGWFEGALIDIQKQLPKNVKIKTCLSCKYSHYSPFGSSMFGNLYCFKKLKERTAKVNDKISLFDIWEIAYKENKLYYVQETFDCEEHEFVEENDWVYKDWIF